MLGIMNCQMSLKVVTYNHTTSWLDVRIGDVEGLMRINLHHKTFHVICWGNCDFNRIDPNINKLAVYKIDDTSLKSGGSSEGR
jgi:hypothetical protein